MQIQFLLSVKLKYLKPYDYMKFHSKIESMILQAGKVLTAVVVKNTSIASKYCIKGLLRQ